MQRSSRSKFLLVVTGLVAVGDTGGVCLGRAARRHRDGHRARTVAVRVRAGVRTAVVGRVRLDGTVHRFRVVRRFRFCFR
ncbi:hypothetical protein Q9Q99_13380 [Curtobacterium flaccumfaciens]|nr:hypothetical protein Q9Q99_13380 [Curtobacterium flaccumfaciens]